jgi:hypothetical protein
MLVTQHNDNARTGNYSEEITLSTTSVTRNGFGKVAEAFVDGQIYAQPLLVPLTRRHHPTHLVLIVATMHNTLHAFRADTFRSDGSGALAYYWDPIHLVDPVQLPDSNIGDSGYTDIVWELGIVSTPVVDTSTQMIYCVTHNYGPSESKVTGKPVCILWAVQLSTGQVIANSGPIKPPDFGPKGSKSSFETNRQLQRSAITLNPSLSLVYVAF